jgi:hypothetical protein
MKSRKEMNYAILRDFSPNGLSVASKISLGLSHFSPFSQLTERTGSSHYDV